MVAAILLFERLIPETYTNKSNPLQGANMKFFLKDNAATHRDEIVWVLLRLVEIIIK